MRRVLVVLVSGVLLVGVNTRTESLAQELRDVQVPIDSLTPSATFKIGRNADWVLVTDDAVWVGGKKPNSVQRIDPRTNTLIAEVSLPGEACSGLAFGFGSVWVPLCNETPGEKPTLVRVDIRTNKISARLPIGPPFPEGGITASADSVWMVTDFQSTLNRIDPATNTVRQRILIPPRSYNPIFSDGMIWISGLATNVLTFVDARNVEVLGSIPVGPKPRFLTAGGGSIWTLNQSDGTVSRVDARTKKLTATIAGMLGAGGDIDYGADSVWVSVMNIPLTRIDAKTNKVMRQWVGRGGDSLRYGFDSIWLTDYRGGLLLRIPANQVLNQ